MSASADSAVHITMPRLSDQMEEAAIAHWLKRTGDVVERGDEIVEIETDKATVAYESEAAGVIQTLAEEGDLVALDSLIAIIHPAGTDVASLAAAVPPVAQTPSPSAAAVPLPSARSVDAARAFASPFARKLARERGLDLAGLTGTGPGGRILRRDLDAAGAGSAPAQAPTAAEPAAKVTPLSRRQRLVADRMVATKQSVPEFVVAIDIDVTRLRKARARLASGDSPLPSYNDFIVKAVGVAVARHPKFRSAYDADGIRVSSRIDVGIAVTNGDDLFVPVIRDVDRLSLGKIAETARALVNRVRAGSVSVEDLSGGVITVSNLGMFGTTSFQAILHGGQTAIIAVGAVQRRAVPRKRRLAIRDIATLTVTADHRVVYGADVARFLATVRDLLEEPVGFLL